LITYLFDIGRSIVPFDFEVRDCWNVVFEIINSKDVSRSPTLPFVVRQTRRVISEELAIRNIVWMIAQTSLEA
jgi:hypothetical protein